MSSSAEAANKFYCFWAAVISSPVAALNQFLRMSIDIFVGALPSTPDNMKLTNLLAALPSAYPNFPWGIVSEIFQGILGILAIYLIVKIFKFIPFFGG